MLVFVAFAGVRKVWQKPKLSLSHLTTWDYNIKLMLVNVNLIIF